MKKLCSLFLALCLVFLLSACGNDNSTTDNDNGSFCVECGEKIAPTNRFCGSCGAPVASVEHTTETSIITTNKTTTPPTTCNHSWRHATCTTPKTCEKCNLTEGEANGHWWYEATCTDGRICTVCLAEDPNSEALGHSFDQGVCQTCGDIDTKLQQMAALGIDAAYNSAKFPSSLHLSAVTYEDRVNDHGDPITRMVMRCYASNSFGGYGDIYVVVLCCEYQTDYIDYEWDGLYFTTSSYSSSPGMCSYTLQNDCAMRAYQDLIINPKDIPYD